MSDTLGPLEAHPAAAEALKYLRGLGQARLIEYHDFFARFDQVGQRGHQVCRGTLKRLIDGGVVGERYLMGLAWAVKELEAGRARQITKS